MSNAHLSLRLPDYLATALDRAAAARGIGKSRIVREAVGQYLARDVARGEAAPLLAGEFRTIWEALPHLNVDEAATFDRDGREARATLALPDDPWA